MLSKICGRLSFQLEERTFTVRIQSVHVALAPEKFLFHFVGVHRGNQSTGQRLHISEVGLHSDMRIVMRRGMTGVAAAHHAHVQGWRVLVGEHGRRGGHGLILADDCGRRGGEF